MKGLSIEQKAKAYDKALGKAEDALNDGTISNNTIAYLQDIFPELKESEDEKIRKTLIRFHKSTIDVDGIKGEDIIAWLENLNLIMAKSPQLGEQKTTDKVEPKFKVGDWVIDRQDIVHQIANVIENVTNHTYGYDIVGGGYFNDNVEDVRLWTIQDAKEGDVLCTYECDKPKIVFILKGTPKKHYALSYHCYCNIMYPHFASDSEKGCLAPNDEDVKPATKEQRDTLERAMHNAGYEWDAIHKQLKKIEQKPTEDVDLPEFESYLCLMFQKFRANGMCTNGEIIDYVKEHSQKLRDILVNPAWSEEDSLQLAAAINIVTNSGHTCTSDWLKSLKDRCTWKPSSLQMECLHDAIKHYHTNGYPASKLKELYEQMSKIYKL